MRLVVMVMGLVALGIGCRQENPDWLGPDPTVADGSTSVVDGSAGEMTTNATAPGDSSGDMCGAGEMLCGSTCRDVLSDRKNCGDCGNMCTGGDQCVDGMCQ